MKNQLILNNKGKNIVLIGIACHLKEYRFCWLLNNQLEVKLTRIKDLVVSVFGKKKQENTFPVFYYEEPEKQEQYFLIGNHGPAGDLLEQKPPVDYLLFIREMNTIDGTVSIIRSVKEIGQVLTAFNIMLNDIPSVEVVLSDIELLLLEYQKK